MGSLNMQYKSTLHTPLGLGQKQELEQELWRLLGQRTEQYHALLWQYFSKMMF